MIPPLSEALAERGFDTLTPVQEAVTKPEIGEADLLVSAQTGSGKTVGFGLAIAPTVLGEAHRFGPAGSPLALAVAPTRELAFQVMQELRWLYAKTGAIVNACVGGMDIRQERRLLDRGTHIVVGTPGRLCDHIRRGALDLSGVRAVVLDEADEMLDLGFREDLEFILNEAPAERRTLLFSATVSPVIARIADEFQKDAKRINTIDKAQQHADISYQALRVAQSDSDHAIFNLLRYHESESAIVFANTRAQVTHLTTRLANRGLPVVSLSGELSQTERSHALQAMRDGRARVCVATDVAARGIDLPNLNLVIHADLPTNTESLLHRSGRTGRAGRKGMSVLIVPPKLAKKAERLLSWAKIRAEWGVPPSADDILQKDEERLLSDPAWSEPLTAEQEDFAKRLLALHSPDAVAAAVWRMHQARHSAPEDLQSPDAPQRREKREFGPSRWFALSVGRNDRAEPRWLLPMILRAADLNKDAIGAIRVQDSESYVEIAEAQVAKLQAALGSDGKLSDDVTARLLDGVPEGAQRPARQPYAGNKPRFEGKDRSGPKRDKSDRPQRTERPARPQTADRKPPAERPAPVERPAPAERKAPVERQASAAEPKAAGPKREKSDTSAKVWQSKPEAKGKSHRPGAESAGKSFRKGKPSSGKPSTRADGASGKPKSHPKSAGKPKPGGKPGGSKAGIGGPRRGGDALPKRKPR